MKELKNLTALKSLKELLMNILVQLKVKGPFLTLYMLMEVISVTMFIEMLLIHINI